MKDDESPETPDLAAAKNMVFSLSLVIFPSFLTLHFWDFPAACFDETGG
jgi:hypothetical protein